MEILGPYYDPIPEEKEENDAPKDIMSDEWYEDFISDLLQPKLCTRSFEVVTLSKEEIEQSNRRAKAVVELYNSNRAKGISSDETYEMLERREIIIDV